MARFTGRNSVITMYQSDGTTVDVQLVCNIKEATSLEFTTDAVEVTSLCQDEKEFVPGLREAKMSLTLLHDNGTYATSPQKLIEDVFFGGLTRVYKLRPQGTGSGKPQFSFSGIMSAYKASMNNNEAVASDVEIQVTGDVTVTAQ